MIQIKRFSILFLLFMVTASCVSKKKIVYFQNDAVNQEKNSNNYTTFFKSDDLLEIKVSALEADATAPFNLISGGARAEQIPYLIDSKGEIDFPILGKIKLGGLTREQAIDLLKNKLSQDIKNPSVHIKIINFKITVLGDVKNPGTYTIPNERITILEAFGLAGDLNISGRRNNIKVQREEGGKKVFYKMDLLSNKIFNSPAYYLQQNDVVYVEPNKAKSQSASYNQNTGLFISIASILISVIVLLTK